MPDHDVVLTFECSLPRAPAGAEPDLVLEILDTQTLLHLVEAAFEHLLSPLTRQDYFSHLWRVTAPAPGGGSGVRVHEGPFAHAQVRPEAIMESHEGSTALRDMQLAVGASLPFVFDGSLALTFVVRSACALGAAESTDEWPRCLGVSATAQAKLDALDATQAAERDADRAQPTLADESPLTADEYARLAEAWASEQVGQALQAMVAAGKRKKRKHERPDEWHDSYRAAKRAVYTAAARLFNDSSWDPTRDESPFGLRPRFVRARPERVLVAELQHELSIDLSHHVRAFRETIGAGHGKLSLTASDKAIRARFAHVEKVLGGVEFKELLRDFTWLYCRRERPARGQQEPPDDALAYLVHVCGLGARGADSAGRLWALSHDGTLGQDGFIAVDILKATAPDDDYADMGAIVPRKAPPRGMSDAAHRAMLELYRAKASGFAEDALELRQRFPDVFPKPERVTQVSEAAVAALAARAAGGRGD